MRTCTVECIMLFLILNSIDREQGVQCLSSYTAFVTQAVFAILVRLSAHASLSKSIIHAYLLT